MSFLVFQAVSYGAFGVPQFSTKQCGIGTIVFEKFLHNKSDEDRKIGCLFTVISPLSPTELDPTGIWTLRHSKFLKNTDVSTKISEIIHTL